MTYESLSCFQGKWLIIWTSVKEKVVHYYGPSVVKGTKIRNPFSVCGWPTTVAFECNGGWPLERPGRYKTTMKASVKSGHYPTHTYCVLNVDFQWRTPPSVAKLSQLCTCKQLHMSLICTWLATRSSCACLCDVPFIGGHVPKDTLGAFCWSACVCICIIVHL